MKTFKYSIKKTTSFLVLGLTILLFSSCGTHNQNDYDEADGIYSSGKNKVATEDVSKAEAEEETAKNNYYKQYFNTKSNAYKEISEEEDAIITDVEAYYTTETLDEDGYVVKEVNYNEGNGGWGSNATEVSINVYGGFGYSPYFYGGWGMGFGWGYPYYGYGYGYPYYGYGWGHPYYGYGYGGYYGGHGGYYGGYGGYNNYAYNRGRRNTDYYAGRSSSRYSSNGRNSSNRVSTTRSSSTRRGTTNSNRRSSYSRSEQNRRSTTTRTNNIRRSSASSKSTRRSSTTRKSTYRPRTTTRPSSSYRSSGGSSRGGGSYGGGSRGGGSSGGGRRGGL
ncbi:MAG: hypothetical protein COB12_07210 [Flavobacterium sp.]|nr:MAG: hypothetical protein COB12_07210 [Flavobacterium sp.]